MDGGSLWTKTAISSCKTGAGGVAVQNPCHLTFLTYRTTFNQLHTPISNRYYGALSSEYLAPVESVRLR